MNKRVHILPILLLTVICLWGCKDTKKGKVDIDHTLIIYMVADNNLSGNAVANINDLELAFREDYGGRILVFYNSLQGDCEILEIVGDNNTKIIASKTIYTYPAGINSLDPATLSDAIDRCRGYSRTDRYSLILWSHSTGWLPEGTYPAKSGDISQSVDSENISAPQRTFGSTYTYKGEMEICDLQKALPSDLKFEFILGDACHMGSIEVAYELRNNCKYFAGSAAEVLAEGFPYLEAAGDLASGDIKGAAECYFNHYNKFFGPDRSATIAVVESSKMDRVASELKKLTSSDVQLTATQQYGRNLGYNYNLKDLMWDAAQMVEMSWGESEAQPFTMALNSAIAYKAATPVLFENDRYGDIDVNTFCGLSIYIPRLDQPQTLEIYKSGYSWAQDTELYKLAK